MPEFSDKRFFFARFAPAILIGFALATPLIFFGATKAVRSNSNKVQDWLPAGFRETSELGWFRQRFSADQFVVISWDGCRLGDPRQADGPGDDPRIEQFATLLVPEAAPEAGTSSRTPDAAEAKYRLYFKSIITARRLLDQLTSGSNGVPYDTAVSRLTGSLIGPDRKQTCVIVTLTDEAVADFKGAIGRGRARLIGPRQQGVLFDAFAACGIDRDSVRMGGPPVDNVAIDEEGERTLVRLASLAGLLGLGLAWFSLRSIKLTAIVFGCGILSAAAGLASVWVTGEKTDAVVLSMPALIYVLAISGAVHLVNYYREAVEKHGLKGAPDRAIAHGWKPALLCSVTTALGLLSLCASELVPIRKFGLYSAIAMMLMLVVLFCYLPAALQVWPIRTRASSKRAHASDPTLPLSTTAAFWTRFANRIIRHHAAVTLGCVAVIAAVGFGLTRVRTSIDLMKLFDGEARILRDYRWLEANIGRLVPMEVVLRFDRDALRDVADSTATPADFSLLERLELVNAVQTAVEQRFGAQGQDIIGPSMSAVTFVPPLPIQSQGIAAVVRRTVTNAKLEAAYGDLLQSGYMRIDPEDQSELWRISVRVAAFQDVDYGLFSNTLHDDVEPLLDAYRLRRKILERITAAQPDRNCAGAKVIWWKDDATQNSLTELTRITALRKLLQTDRIELIERSQDVSGVPLTELDGLQQFDCVLLTKAVAKADRDLLQGIAPELIYLPKLEQIRVSVVDPAAGPDADRSISSIYTGVVPIVYKAQRALLDSLIQSTFWSFITILPLLMFVSRGVAAGLVAMLPNVLPVLVVFGGIGWLGFSVDIGAMMSASIALGVAVDDTIHYLTWYREELNRTRDRKLAIQAAYQRCATPTLQAALISGLGLSVFACSTFTPTQQFGYLMLTILLTGVVAELIMLPALLAGPLGWAFRPAKRDSQGGELAMAPAPQLQCARKAG